MPVYPIAQGHPDYSSKSTNKFIPEIWSSKLLDKYYDATVLTEITNRDYEGEIKGMGDTVIIRTKATGNVKPYVIGQTLTYDRLESPATELKIDKGFYWGYVIDDVIAYQSDIKLLNQWTQDTAEQLKIEIDSMVLGSIYVDADPKNKGANAGRKSSSVDLGTTGAPVKLEVTNIVNKIVDMGLVLDEQNVPETGRFIIFPPLITALLKKSELKDASITGDPQSVIRKGAVGMIDRFTIYNSNLLSTVVDGGRVCYNIIFGTKTATTFAAQFTKTETLRAESTFGDIIRGLTVFGYKVLRPECLGHLYAYV